MSFVKLNRQSVSVLSVVIDILTWEGALKQVAVLTLRRESTYVCICNVHSVVTASQDGAFDRVLNAADIATPDGALVAWMMRKLGHVGQQRINGQDLMWRSKSAEV